MKSPMRLLERADRKLRNSMVELVGFMDQNPDLDAEIQGDVPPVTR